MNLKHLRDQLRRASAAYDSLAKEIRPVSERRFKVLAEAYLATIDYLRREIASTNREVERDDGGKQ